jgi:hypothetical protein
MFRMLLTAPNLAEHLRRYVMPNDTLEVHELRNFYTDVIAGRGLAG